MFDKIKNDTLALFLMTKDQSNGQSRILATTNQEYQNISPMAQQYIYPLTQEKRDFVKSYLRQYQEKEGLVVTDPVETTKQTLFVVRYMGNGGIEQLKQYIELSWQDIENLILYYLEDGAFCFNRLLYRNSSLYMYIDGQLVHSAGRAYMVNMPKIHSLAAQILRQMRAEGMKVC